MATDADGGFVRRIEMTPANVNDGRMLGAVLPTDPGNIYADLAYASSRNEILIRDAGGSSRVPRRALWGGTEALQRLEAWNREVGHVRRQIEKVFGTWKRSYGLRRIR